MTGRTVGWRVVLLMAVYAVSHFEGTFLVYLFHSPNVTMACGANCGCGSVIPFCKELNVGLVRKLHVVR